VKPLLDHQGLSIRLTDERLAHILEHPEMAGLEVAIAETLMAPKLVIRSLSDTKAQLYYRFYAETSLGNKFVCVVVKSRPPDDAFVLTAYLTDKPKKGAVLWEADK
jgi:hypothetical protein